MSEYDGGYDGGTDYGHVETGEQHESLDQLHQVEYTGADGSHYAESDFTSYDHSEAETDHVFAAEGSENYSASEYHELDALQARLDSAFASATELHTASA